MGMLESLKKSLTGDESTETIKSGTLVTTRGTGVIAVGLIGTFFIMDALEAEPWEGLSPEAKLAFVLATGAIWALIVAADSIARGIAAAAGRPALVRLPAGLIATRTKGRDSPGWTVVAVEIAPNAEQPSMKFLVVKESETMWVDSDELEFQDERRKFQ